MAGRWKKSENKRREEREELRERKNRKNRTVLEEELKHEAIIPESQTYLSAKSRWQAVKVDLINARFNRHS
jgi:hypothetical protein